MDSTGGPTGSGAIAVKMPPSGAWKIEGAGESASAYSINQGFPPGEPVPSIVINAALGGQPPLMAGSYCVFDCTAANAQGVGQGDGVFTLGIYDLLLYQLPSNPLWAVAINGSCYILDIQRCFGQQVGMVQTLTSGGLQPFRITVKDNIGNGIMILSPNNPFIGVASGNVWGSAPDGLIPSGLGGVRGNSIHIEVFNTWFVHDNIFLWQGNGTTLPAQAAIVMQNMWQTSLGSFHDNCYYGATGACIYYKNDTAQPAPGGDLTGGVEIHHEQFVGWNQANFTTGAVGNGSALIIDLSAATTPDQMVTIGTCTYQGGDINPGVSINHSQRGLEIVGNPDTQNIVWSRENLMRDVLTAHYRINGVDYLTSAAGFAGNHVKSYRLHGSIGSPPAVPASGTAQVNNTGMDAQVYVSTGAGVTVSAIALDGATTGLTVAANSAIGPIPVPRGATITLTYAGGTPTWKWYIA
jgi:hypothetical protein